MKKFKVAIAFALILALFASVGAAGVHVNANADLKLVIDGVTISTDVAPLMKQNRTLVPVRVVSENLGMKVNWNAKNNTVTITNKDGKTMSLVIGQKVARVDGKQVSLDVPPEVINGRTVVPIRFISENFGAQVEWSNATRTVTISTSGNAAKENPAYNPNYAEVDKWINTTRISSNWLDSVKQRDIFIKNGTAKDSEINAARFDVEELLWNYYEGKIPASSYEEETMKRLAEKRFEKGSWADISEYDKALYGTFGGFSTHSVILLSYSFNKDNKLEWVVIRPVGMRHAFKLSVDNPYGSVVQNRAWAGRNDASFDAEYSVLATPELLEKIKVSQVPIGVEINSNLADEWNDRGLPYAYSDYSVIRDREILRLNSLTSVVKTQYGGDFSIKVGYLGGYNSQEDYEKGSKIIHPQFIGIRSYTKGTVPFIETAKY